MTARREMYERGVELARRLCALNDVPVPEFFVGSSSEWDGPRGSCGYYESSRIAVCLDATAAIGRGGRAWSYPGHSVDRTAYGVVVHELGHHFDDVLTVGSRSFSGVVRRESGEKALTGYAPNTSEWFAEMFRLFGTNPELLGALRPRTLEVLARRLRPAETRGWREVLADAPQRTLELCERRHGAAERRRA